MSEVHEASSRLAELRRQKRTERAPGRAAELRRRIATLKERTGASDDHPLVKRLIDELNESTAS